MVSMADWFISIPLSKCCVVVAHRWCHFRPFGAAEQPVGVV